MANSNIVQHRGWGGAWTEEKLDCFEKYVRAYLTIMNKYRYRFGWKLLYFDGFAGSGSREQREDTDQKMQSLFGEDVSDKETRLYEGAAERVVKIGMRSTGFDYYYFIDKYEENITLLENKLSHYPTKGTKVFRPGDANEELRKLADFMHKDANLPFGNITKQNMKCLCLLDPFGMSIDWESIVKLAGKSVDLWILVPTGSIVNRLIQRDGTLRFPETLTRFFGLPEEAIRERLTTSEEVTDLFGSRTVVRKTEDAISAIAQLYCEQLGTLFENVTQEPLVLRNEKNVPIFHFVCASDNATACKIAKQIIDKEQDEEKHRKRRHAASFRG